MRGYLARRVDRMQAGAARRRVVVLSMMALLVASSCEGQSLASKVDDLLREGNTLKAIEEMRVGIPKLIESQEASELDDLARVLRERAGSVDPASGQAEVVDAAQSGVRDYFETLQDVSSELPLDDICQAAVERSAGPWNPDEPLADWLRETERAQDTANWCALLGLL